jgi:hypothetical protein
MNKVDPWVALVAEGNHGLISKLKRAVDGEPGFGTVVVNSKGFSENDETHNMVLDWLREKGVHVLDVPYEIGNLELALSKGKPKFLDW